MGENPPGVTGDYSHIAIISVIENIEAKIVLGLNRLIVLTMLEMAMRSKLQGSSMAMAMVVMEMVW